MSYTSRRPPTRTRSSITANPIANMELTNDHTYQPGAPHAAIEMRDVPQRHFSDSIPLQEKPLEVKHAGFFTQFVTVMKKNYIQKRRTLTETCVEVLLPVLFILGLVAIWSATSRGDHAAEQFVKPLKDFTAELYQEVCINGTALGSIQPCPTSVMPMMACFGKKDGLPIDNLCGTPQAISIIANFTEDTGIHHTRNIPPLDTLLIMHWLARAVIDPKNAQYLTAIRGLRNSGYLHFAPDTAATRGLISYLNRTSSLFQYALGQVFSSEAAASDFTSAKTMEGFNWGIVVVNKLDANDFDVTIRLNRSGICSTTYTVEPYYSGGIGDGCYRNYYSTGFLTVERAIQEYYVTEVLGQPSPPDTVQAPMPFADWADVVFLQVAGGVAPLMVVLSYLYPVSQITKRITLEKELRIREAMMIMGLGNASFYLSWVVTYLIQNLITVIITTILLKITFLKKSDGVIIFFLFFFFNLSSITLSGLLSAFFSKSRMAALMSPLIYFVLSIPMFLLDNVPVIVKQLFMVLSPSAFATGVKLLCDHERSQGLGSKQLTSKRDDINMLAILFVIPIDIVIYAVLMLYLDAVLPSEWGTSRHPLFCIVEPIRWLRRRNKKPESSGTLPDARDPHGEYEQQSAQSVVTTSIRGLRKVFERDSGKFVAVNNLHLNLYGDQVNVLLGHNGAGKTTTINLLTGMVEADAGECTVYGKTVNDDLAGVRNEIGLCPQHNILWPELTCAEHLSFFAALKGVTGDEQQRAVDEMLRGVDLLEKKEYPAGDLSGGQKRKLSVAIAFVGGSRLVFLDEPTAGMDVGARRHTWDLIKKMTTGRTILLTTHFMDEADLLGHNISIMSKGRLKCSGSPMFLKSRLGAGYSLTLSIALGTPPAPITSMVQQHVAEAETLPCGAGELSYRLPVNAVPQFPSLFAALETTASNLGVQGFGIAITTLEEIFLAIADENDVEVHEGTPQPSPVMPSPSSGGPRSGGTRPVWEEASTRGSGELRFGRQMTSMLTKRFHNAKRDRRTQCLQIATPVLCILLAMLLTLLDFSKQPDLDLTPKMYDTDVELLTSNCSGMLDSSLFTPPLYHTAVGNVSTARGLSDTLMSEFMRHEDERYSAWHCGDVVTVPFSNRTFLLHNSTGVHEAPAAVNLYYQTFVQSHYNRATRMHIHTHPMDLTGRENAFVSSIKTLMIGIVIMIPFTFIPSTYVSWVVKERECKAKHLQTVSGLNYFVYWWSNFIFDICSFLLTEALVIIVFFIFRRNEYIGSAEKFFGLFVLFLLYGASGVAASYAVNFIFSTHSSAQNIVMLVNFIAGFLLVLVIWILESIKSTADAAKVIRFIFRVAPSYCLGEGIINMAVSDIYSTFGEKRGTFSFKVTGWDILFMALEFPVFMIITLMYDHPSRQKRAQQLFHDPNVMPPPIEGEDEDVVRERDEVESGHPSRHMDLVTVKHMCKRYGNGKVAVKNLSFGVHGGEIFGFLGTNGAGKTTTISILCGEQLPTHGHGTICGCDVVDQAMEAQRHIGYCPQFDALLDLLTPVEHLKLYSVLRDLPVEGTDATVEALLTVTGLDAHRDTVAMNLSGGNRRKLSVAVSLIGAPNVVFLDEPSAGMDPMARRGLWRVIEKIAERSSVVLTTHHLEEVEALAHRVAIMVDGKLMCIGDKTHLKTKFGSGFEMTLRVENESRCDPLRRFVADRLPQRSAQRVPQPEVHLRASAEHDAVADIPGDRVG